MPRLSILMFHNASEVALSSVRSCACKFYGQHSVRSFATKKTKRKLGRINFAKTSGAEMTMVYSEGEKTINNK